MDAVLDIAVARAGEYLEQSTSRPIGATVAVDELRRRLAKPLPEYGTAAEDVIAELARDTDGGLVGSTSGRFFGWVIGGTLPVALAADWLTSAWDQNAASNLSSPAEAVIEEVCGGWLKDLLGVPSSASFAFVTGCQMAHTTALAAARHQLLRDRGWDVERSGLAGAPPLRVLAAENAHESFLRSLRLLGFGTQAIVRVPTDAAGRLDLAALAGALNADNDRPTIVWLQAGELNTGVFDSFAPACTIAHKAGAWVHVDGAFGLWVATSERYRHLLEGVEHADSWATDAHKWLNVPYDSGLAFVAHPEAHRAAMRKTAGYFPDERPGERDSDAFVPESSRRARGFAVWAALRTLGRPGVAELVDRCCALARRFALALDEMPGVQVLNDVVLNQVLVRFGDSDEVTHRVIAAAQDEGTCWFGATVWQGMAAARISVSNWSTTEADIDRSVAAIHGLL